MTYPSLTMLKAQYQGPDPPAEAGVETLMIRNLPRGYSAETLLTELGHSCDVASCNMVHLPWHSRRASNIGYAFVNFADTEAAQRCQLVMSGRRWRLAEKKRVCRVVSAHVQGISANLAQYVFSAEKVCLEPPYAPIVFVKGHPVDLAAAVHAFCDVSVSQHMHLNCAREVKIDAAKLNWKIPSAMSTSALKCSLSDSEDVDAVSTAASSASDYFEISRRSDENTDGTDPVCWLQNTKQSKFQAPEPPWPHALMSQPRNNFKCGHSLHTSMTRHVGPKWAREVDGELLTLFSEFSL
uniref:RRM domain-containing protein n=1 Tax=Noctiluca scintillans TaxID=2966 RepID=A0A6T9HNP2_NOCSC|mmetsp:Transcript_64826/g.171591  ORF Transcript_64826/g.171591 Transcript_64826/m.171591 type:complete len:296 (+) Transcript_64826:80-967(+)